MSNKRRYRIKKLIQQKLMGLAFIAISIFCLWMASNGNTVQERDCTALILTVPVGLYLLFSRKIVVY